jgi:hypothetical protein
MAKSKHNWDSFGTGPYTKLRTALAEANWRLGSRYVLDDPTLVPESCIDVWLAPNGKLLVVQRWDGDKGGFSDYLQPTDDDCMTATSIARALAYGSGDKSALAEAKGLALLAAEKKARGRDENLVAIGGYFMSDRRYSAFYDAHVDDLQGFPGIHNYLIDAARAFTAEEPEDDNDFDWMDAIDNFVEAMHAGQGVLDDSELRALAKTSIQKTLHIPENKPE